MISQSKKACINLDSGSDNDNVDLDNTNDINIY